MRFYLGTHKPRWVSKITEIPLFVSRRTILREFPKIKAWPRATTPWVLDSGGFTELDTNGKWTITPRQYAKFVRRCQEDIGMMEWAAPMDWMCEPRVLEQTGLSVAAHQSRTLANYLVLRTLDPDLPIIPVLQGWTPDDYLHHVEMYEKAGVPLENQKLVGLGSVCRRQATKEIRDIVVALHSVGIKLHGFGCKIQGLAMYAPYLSSADSMAWSKRAFIRQERIIGHTHKNCANCLVYALRWRRQVLRAQAS